MPARARATRSAPQVALSLAVAAYAAFVYLWRLGHADWLPDEVLYARAGRAYLQGDHSENLEHPPLAKLAFGLGQLVVDGRVGARLVAALAGLAIGLLIYFWVRQLAGWRWGLAAAALWAALPHVVPWDKLDRYAMLDVVAAALAFAVLRTGWHWARTGAWPAAAGSGVLLGLATASKLPGALVGPVVVAAAVVLLRPARRAAAQLALLVVCAGAAFIAAYLPLGTAALDAAAVPVTYQLAHAEAGHTVLLAGTAYDHAPWWSHLYFAVRDDGLLMTASLVLLAAAAVLTPAHRAVATYLLGAVVLPLAVLAASPVALPHYRFLWLPPLVLLAALGLRALTLRGRLAAALAVVLLVPLAVAGGRHAAAVLSTGQGPYARAACTLDALASGREVLVRGYPDVLAADAPQVSVVTELGPDAVPAAVLLDRRVTSRFPRPEVERLLQRAAFVEVPLGGVTLHLHRDVAGEQRLQATARRCGLHRPG